MNVLALDLATTTGWTFGEVGCEKPRSGTVRFGSAQSSHEAIFGNALRWTSETLREFEPALLVWETPLATPFKTGKTNVSTTAVLYGLPAIVGAVAYLLKIVDVRRADTSAVRHHFIGSNPKRAIAKHLTMKQCRAMGWDVADDNEADALALWHYTCSHIDPKLALRTTPLFLRRSA